MDAVTSFLLEGEPGRTANELFVGTLERLVADGVPLWRSVFSLMTNHPEIWSRTLRWRRGEPLEVMEQPETILRSPDFVRSPADDVITGHEALRARLKDGQFFGYVALEEIARAGEPGGGGIIHVIAPTATGGTLDVSGGFGGSTNTSGTSWSGGGGGACAGSGGNGASTTANSAAGNGEAGAAIVTYADPTSMF